VGTDGDICWERTLPGRNPARVCIVNSTILCSYIDDQGEPGTPGRHRLVCLDLEGHEQWSARDFELHAVLADERLLGMTQAGELRALDLRGRKAKTLRLKHVTEVAVTHQHVLMRTEKELVVGDLSLNVIARFGSPPPLGGVLVDDALLFLDREHIMRRDRQGRVESLCRLPDALAYDAMSRWERDTGRAALEGNWKAVIDPNADLETELAAVLKDPSRQKSFGLGDRAPRLMWMLSYLDATNTLVLSNFTSPHVLVCLGLDGDAKWSTYLSPGCCGGSPASLPNGDLVVSSGCGGMLSWLDPTGRVKHRSTPDLALYSPHVTALSDSSCIVRGNGVACYAADRALRWQWPEDCSCFDYDERLGLLATAGWSRLHEKSIAIRCVKNLDRRSARA
jgi:hypothetical protein